MRLISLNSHSRLYSLKNLLLLKYIIGVNIHRYRQTIYSRPNPSRTVSVWKTVMTHQSLAYCCIKSFIFVERYGHSLWSVETRNVSYSDSTYSVLPTLRASKHVIFHEKYSDSCPSTEYQRWNIDGEYYVFRLPQGSRNAESKDRIWTSCASIQSILWCNYLSMFSILVKH